MLVDFFIPYTHCPVCSEAMGGSRSISAIESELMVGDLGDGSAEGKNRSVLINMITRSTKLTKLNRKHRAVIKITYNGLTLPYFVFFIKYVLPLQKLLKT